MFPNGGQAVVQNKIVAQVIAQQRNEARADAAIIGRAQVIPEQPDTARNDVGGMAVIWEVD